MSKQITIRMPKKLLADWLAALRSGKYVQGYGRLRTQPAPGQYAYCCLGVLQHVKDGAVEMTGFAPAHRTCVLPSEKWLVNAGVTFHGANFAGATPTPYLPTLKVPADHANDSRAVSFAQIADAIEACAEGY